LLAPPGRSLGELRVRIVARDELWPWFDGESPLDEQALLGAATALESHTVPAQPARKFQWSYRADETGRLVLPGLLPELPFEIEVENEAGRLLVTRELVLGPGEWRSLELPLAP
jgi:hypothetical protein